MQSDDGLSFSMSVAILPEAAALDSIEALRTGMQSPEKSALQLKMLTPFFTPQVFAQRAVVEDLTTFCARRKPFTLRLDSLDIFEHGKRGFTVQLMPSVVSDSDLKDLRRLLEVQFPRCTGKIAFKPHMTLAPFATRPEAEAALEKIRASLTPIEWTVSKLHIVEEDGLKCTTLHSIALASATALPVAAVAPQLSPTPVFRFRDGKWTQIDVAKEPPSAPATLSVVSWNVLYPVYKAELIFTDDRVPHVLRELEATNADVIGLQEVTKEFVAKLVAAEWVKQRYYVSDITGATVRPYGQLVLSLHPFSAAIHHWNNQKKMLFADFSLNNRRMIVSVLHLTSTLAKNAQATRQAQMQLVYGLIPPGADSVIIGDFNVENEEEARGLLRPDWIDCWASLRPEEAGLTFDPHVNTTANITSHSKVARRYDRCLARTHHLTPTSVGLFATDSIVWDATASAGARAAVLFASDHYGLKTCFKWDPNPALPSLDPLYSALAPHRPFECHAGVNVMTQLPARISAILLRCIPPPIVIQVSGGLRLGTFGPGSDADLVCFGRFAPAEFFELAKKALAAPESGVTSVHFIKEAFVPLITFRWNQIDVDLEYCCVPSGLELSRAPALMTNEHAKQMDERSLRCINGCRDWDLILSAVPDVPLFRLLVAAVKLWAKRRGVYVARMGFLGGFSYTVLAARIAQLYPRADSRELLCRFFADYAAWDWTRPVAVAVVDNPTFTPEARDQMSIVTLSRPVRNSARHVTVSTRQIIAAELGRAAAICKGAAGATLSELMDELVQPLAFFRQHQFYVQIAVSAVTKKEHAAFVGYVEGKFPVLLIRVEEARFVGFPLSHSTPNPDSGFPFSVSYWIGLDCGQADAVNVTATLVDVAATFRKTENMDILVKLRSAAEAEALAKGAGAAQNGEDDEEEEEEEEEADEAEAEAGEAGKPAAAAHSNAKGRWAPHKQKKYKRVDVDALDTGGAEAVPKTEKMRTGIEAYNRLKWDESVDVKDVVIGFEDRFLGVVECPWHEFDIENVPLHRLRYFKHKGIVVYDRIHRIDTLFHHRKSKP